MVRIASGLITNRGQCLAMKQELSLGRERDGSDSNNEKKNTVIISKMKDVAMDTLEGKMKKT